MPIKFTWFSPKSNSANCRNRLYSCGFTLSKRQPLHLNTFKSCTVSRKQISYGIFWAAGKFGKSISFVIERPRKVNNRFYTCTSLNTSGGKSSMGLPLRSRFFNLLRFRNRRGTNSMIELSAKLSVFSS